MAQKKKDVVAQMPEGALQSRSFRAIDNLGEMFGSFLYIFAVSFLVISVLGYGLDRFLHLLQFNWSAASFLSLLIAGLVEVVFVLIALAERLTKRDLDRSGQVGDRYTLLPKTPAKENFRIIPHYSNQSTISIASGPELDREDLKEFVKHLGHRGTTRRDWTGETGDHPRFVFRSGRDCSPEYFNQLIEFVEEMGWISERGPGKTPKLNKDPGAMLLAVINMSAGMEEGEWPDAH